MNNSPAVYFKIDRILAIHYLNLSAEYVGEPKENWTLIYIEKGEAILIIDGKLIKLEKSHIFILPPGASFSIKKDIHCKNMVFLLALKTRASHLFNLANINIYLPNKYVFLLHSVSYEIKTAYHLKPNTLLTEFKIKDSSFFGAYQIIRIYIEHLILLLNNIRTDLHFLPNNIQIKELANSISEMMKNNIDRKISNIEICRKFNYSNAIISKVFMQVYGHSIQKHFLILKINHAKKLLRESNYKIIQISDLLNFSSPQYFSKLFKNIAGIAPSDYRKNVKIDSKIN